MLPVFMVILLHKGSAKRHRLLIAAHKRSFLAELNVKKAE